MWWVSLAVAAEVRVTLAPGSPPFGAVEVRCGTYRDRGAFVDGVATVSHLPDDAACTAYFKGGPPAKAVVSASALTCGFRGAIAVCAPTPPADPGPTAARVVVSPNLRLAPDAPAWTRVHVSCAAPRFEADADVIDGAATVPGLPDAPCVATFSAPPPVRVALPGGPATCGPAGCEPGAAAPGPAVAPVTVTLTGAPAPVSVVEVACPSGYRSRVELVDGRAVLPDVPVEGCWMYLKGGVPLRAPVSGGQSKTCVFDRPSGAWPRCT